MSSCADRLPELNDVCSACGREFHCGIRAGAGRCWCFELPVRLPMPSGGEDGCLCGECLQRRIDAMDGKPVAG